MNDPVKRPYLVAALVIACGLAVHAREPAPASTTVPDPDPQRFAAAIRAFEARDRQNSYPRDAILFVGSSSIAMWQTADAFPGLRVINRGFGGSVITDATHYADRIVVKYHPRIIVFYSGDNDIAAGMSPQKVFGDFRDFVTLVHKELPTTRIIYLPIKPSLARWQKWPQMQQANALVADHAQHDDHLEIVDTATPLLGPDGKPRLEIFQGDGLHMNAKGYAIWNQLLTPVLKQAFATH